MTLSLLRLAPASYLDAKNPTSDTSCYGSSDKSVSRVLLPQCPGREHSGSHQLYSNDRRTITHALRITGHQNATGTRRSTQHEITTNTELSRSGNRRLYRSQPLSGTFLNIPEHSGNPHRRPFLDHSRTPENSPEPTRHFWNVRNCAVNRNSAVIILRNNQLLRSYPPARAALRSYPPARANM